MRIRSVLSFSVGTFLSRILGFLREIVFAYSLGASGYADAVVVAIRIPTMLRGMLAEGVSQNAFVPVLTRWKDRRLLWALFTIIVGAAALLVPLGILLAPTIVRVVAPGFLSDPHKYSFAVWGVRITFPALLFISVSAVAMGILNTKGRFFITGVSPVFFNLGNIALLLFARRWPILGAVAFTFGTFLQATFLMIFIKEKWEKPNFKHPALKEFIKNWLSMSLNTGFLQTATLINTVVASTLPTGSLAYLSYAFRLVHLPQGLFGVATGTVLSKSVSEDVDNARQHLWRGLLFVSSITLLVVLLYVLFGDVFVEIAFVRGKFSSTDAQSTFRTLLGYVPTIPAYALSSVFVSYLFATFRRKLANLGLALSTALNIALVFPLARLLGTSGVALAVSLSVSASVLFWSFKLFGFSKESLLSSLSLGLAFAVALWRLVG
ncbi:MAG: murein biosynthesis integral membrane protein MurJ [Thermotogae bacterium]|nr:murein biosynthesis integral membrane protein MurJ [Thermotogota bacterium]